MNFPVLTRIFLLLLKKDLCGVRRHPVVHISIQSDLIAVYLHGLCGLHNGYHGPVAVSTAQQANIQIYSDVMAVHSAGIQTAPMIAPGGIDDGGRGEV